MRRIILLIAGITLCFSLSAQGELTLRGGNISQDGTRLSPEQVRAVMADNSEALAQFNRGRSLAITGQVIAYPSAFLLGWDTGTRLGGGEGNNTLLAIGAVGTAVGLGIVFLGERNIRSSVSLFNSSKANNDAISYQVNFGLTQNGIGFAVVF